jgi:uncharacterized protein YraI
MIGRSKVLAMGVLIAGLMVPAQAKAAFEANTLVDLNLRIGPATTYGVIDVIPAGYPVTVIGCLSEVNWCDVDFEGLRGWVAARYLVRPGTTVYLPQWAPQGLPIVSFSFGVYHDRHYRDRPWHRQRTGRWQGRQEVHTPRSTRPSYTSPRTQRPSRAERRSDTSPRDERRSGPPEPFIWDGVHAPWGR